MAAKRILELSELKNIKPPEPIPGTPLISRGFNVIYGPSGHYKSFYALHQALTVAETSQVVYVAAEGSAGFDWRIDAWCEHYKKEKPEGRLRFIIEEVNLLDKIEVAGLVKLIQTKTKKATLIVIDTYARCLVGGDENGAKDPGIAIQQCATLQRTFDCAVALVHHTNLGGVRERGNTALRGAADTMIRVSTDDGLIRVKCDKVKDRKPWANVNYQFVELPPSGVLVTTDQISTTKMTENEMDILELLNLEAFIDCGARSNQISKALNIPDASLYRVLSKLERNSLIVHHTKGDPFKITEIGKETFARLSGESKKIRKVLEQYELEIQVE
jgi:AAA domain